MKIVHFTPRDPHTGSVCCPACSVVTRSWMSSGMSACYPHFFCDRCSNVLHRTDDHALVYVQGSTAAVLSQIEPTLPSCPCGGAFKPGANPKCPACHTEFAHQSDPIKRLSDPHMLVLEGACVCDDGQPVATIRYRLEFKEAT